MDSLEKVYSASRLALDKEAQDLKILDMRGLSNYCDFFVVVTASSERRAQTIAENIQEGLGLSSADIRAKEGLGTSWVLLDLFNVVVHIFEEGAREFYNLEKLWQDAPLIEYPPKTHERLRDRKSIKRPAGRKPEKSL